jgi:dolichol-phosphate mannosyltransferase
MSSTASLASEGAKPLVSIVCPAFNEEAVLPLFHAVLTNTLEMTLAPSSWEIIYVDDGSTDQTWEIMVQLIRNVPGAKAIRLARNVGQQHAMTAGIEHAIGDAVVTMDTDLQHPPELIFDLVNVWKEGASVVQTVRMEDPNLSYFKRITSRLFGNVMGWLSGLDVRPGAADFRLLDRAAVNSLNAMHDNPRLMRAAVASLKYPTQYIDYHPRNRAAGVSKYGLRKMLMLAVQGFWSYGQGFNWILTGMREAGLLGCIVSIPFICLAYDYGYSLGLTIFGISFSVWLISTIGVNWHARVSGIAANQIAASRYIVAAKAISQTRRNPEDMESLVGVARSA